MLAHREQALEVLLPLVQAAAEMARPSNGFTPQMGDEDHELLDTLERSRARTKRKISDMANPYFGSIFR